MRGAWILIVLMLIGCAHYQRDPWTKEDTALALAGIVAVSADAYTTTRFLDHDMNRELNPILGERPTDTEVVAVLAVGQAITIGVAYFLPKEYRRALLGGKAIANTGCAIHNTTLEW